MSKVKRHNHILPLVFCLLAEFVILTGFDCPIQADTVPVTNGAVLIEQAKALNGQTVVYQGEVIGDLMPRQDHYWINILNQGTAIGVWITAEERAHISFAGQYGIQGDQVIITGQFNQACPEHGGDLDIHAESLTLVAAGGNRPEPLDFTRVILAVILLLTALSSLALLIRRWTRVHA